jgi:hypothetical protein
MTIYQRGKSAEVEARETLEQHRANQNGWCVGCAKAGITVRAGCCDAAEQAKRTLRQVANYVSGRS